MLGFVPFVRPCGLLFAVVAAAWVAAGCTKETPGFCCSSVDSCNGTGASSVVMCDQTGGRPVCDDEGVHGPAHTCIPDPTAPGCTSSLECLTPERPVCDIEDTGTCIGCGGPNDCTRFTDQRLCDLDTGRCVECNTNLDCTDTNMPICDPDGRCRGCTEDGQCPSGLCDTGAGACVLEADIIYVNRSTGAGTACTMATPCPTITAGVAAITATRRFMRISNEVYQESVVLDGKQVRIIAPGASLQPGGLNQAALLVLNESDVEISGLRLFGAGGGANADGLRCAAPMSGTPMVQMSNLRIEGNGGFGIDATGCSITLVSSEVVDNPGGGVSITAGTFVLRNNFITGNGAATAVGGVKLDANTAIGVFEFNTVAGNLASAGIPAALFCSGTQNQPIRNNILHGVAADQVSSMNCDLRFNLSNEGISGEGNVMASPQFVSATDYHLMSGSEGVNDADPSASLNVDFDGEMRPLNGRRDIGADEVAIP
jgi:hypothetical protein